MRVKRSSMRCGGAGTSRHATIPTSACSPRHGTCGDEAPARVLGDYSVVVHDRESRATTLVRDPFGVRMLSITSATRRASSSPTRSPRCSTPASPRDLDEDAIADFVAEGYNEDPATTVYRAVRRVPPAHRCGCSPTAARRRAATGRCRPRRSTARATRRRSSPSSAPCSRRACATGSARRSLTVFMSGGLDSTTLAAIAARELEDRTRLVARTSHLPTLVPTDETRCARIVAESLGISHVLTDVDGYGYREGTWLAAPDTPEPVSDPDVLALQDELRRASAHAPVAFWGEDPDSLLAPPHLRDLLRGSPAWRVALDVLGYMMREQRAAVSRACAISCAGARRGTRDRRRTADRPGCAPIFGRAAPSACARATRPSHPTRSEVGAPARRVRTGSRFSSRSTRECTASRSTCGCPFLDRRLIELALGLPPIPWMQRKHVLREAVRGLVPGSARCAPKRGTAGVVRGAARAVVGARPRAVHALARRSREFVDVGALPPIDRSSSAADVRMNLRLRILDRWLRVPTPVRRVIFRLSAPSSPRAARRSAAHSRTSETAR